MSQVHELKTDIDMYTAVVQGKKTYELRFDDRGFKVGDTLFLNETLYTGSEMKQGQPLVYTGRGFKTKIKHILRGPVYGLMDGWVILSIE